MAPPSDQTDDAEYKPPEDEGVEEEEEEEKKDEIAETTADDVDYKDWPFKAIKDPHDNDVLYGRGGGTNHHPGNKLYRKMVEEKKVEYVNCKRLDKPLVALSIIKTWRSQKPPGRFLKMDDKTGLWNDVGDKKAREKTSQALREKAPEIRKELEREKRIQNGESVSDEEEDVDEKPGLVVRNHSLGKDYVKGDQGPSVLGFHWTEGVRQGSETYPQPFEDAYGRTSSNGSFAPPQMPPPGVFPEHMTSGDQVQMMFGQRYESGGSVHSIPYGNYPPMHTTSWSARDHSLSQNQLPHATCNQAAYPAAFDQTRTPSGQWRPPPMPMTYHYTPPVGHPQYRVPSAGGGQYAPQSPYAVDPAVASQWSTQGMPPPPLHNNIQQHHSSSSSQGQPVPPQPANGGYNNSDSYQAPPYQQQQAAPKPEIVKRATSHQNETAETKLGYNDGQSVKRAFLSRDGSIASSRLKQEYVEEQKEAPPARPSALTLEERMSTLDLQPLDGSTKPKTVKAGNRLSTFDALSLDFDNPDRGSLEDLFTNENVEKPASLKTELRVTTMDLIDIVNDPLPFTEV